MTDYSKLLERLLVSSYPDARDAGTAIRDLIAERDAARDMNVSLIAERDAALRDAGASAYQKMQQEARVEAAEKRLADVVKAWEALEGGRDYKPYVIETWLRVHMTPAINNARAVLNDKKPGHPEG